MWKAKFKVYVETGTLASSPTGVGWASYERLFLKTSRKLYLEGQRELPKCTINFGRIDLGFTIEEGRDDRRRYLIGGKSMELSGTIPTSVMRA